MKGKEKLNALIDKYEAEINKRLGNKSLIKAEVKEEIIKQEVVKDEPIEEVITLSPSKEAQPIFHVSDDLLSKMQSLSIDPHENKFNFATNTFKTITNDSSSSTSTQEQEAERFLERITKVNEKTKEKTGDKTLKFLSLEESTELVKQKKFISRNISLAASRQFSSDEEDDDYDDDDDDEGMNLSEDEA